MKYLQYLNSVMKEEVETSSPTVVFGQNVNGGSCIGGLSRGLAGEKSNGMTLNTPNSENTAVGVGFGLMLAGVSSVFYMKQLDFLLLGIDQLVNTYNYIRTIPAKASFTIMPVIVDSGYEGLQASLNTLHDYSSIARLDAYSITNKHDIDFVAKKIMAKPGFRIIGVSQRLTKKDLIEFSSPPVANAEDGSWFHYKDGSDLTIACFNFSLPQGKELSENLSTSGLSSSLFSVNCIPDIDWKYILSDVAKTKKLLIIDDSKSVNTFGQKLAIEAIKHIPNVKLLIQQRKYSQEWFKPNSDNFMLNEQEVSEWLEGPKQQSL